MPESESPLSDEELAEWRKQAALLNLPTMQSTVNRLLATIDARDAAIARLAAEMERRDRISGGLEHFQRVLDLTEQAQAERDRYKAALDEAVMLLNEHQLAHGTAAEKRREQPPGAEWSGRPVIDPVADVWRTHRDTFLSRLTAALNEQPGTAK